MENEMKEATYSPKAIMAELKKVQWPTMKELMGQSGMVILFTVLFGFYFFICELVASGLVSWIVSL